MEIEVKGSTEPYQILLEPYALVIPGEIFISTAIRRQFKVIHSTIYIMLIMFIELSVVLFVFIYQMWNHSKTFILFQWERMNSSSHIIEVEPTSGRIGGLHTERVMCPDKMCFALFIF